MGHPVDISKNHGSSLFVTSFYINQYSIRFDVEQGSILFDKILHKSLFRYFMSGFPMTPHVRRWSVGWLGVRSVIISINMVGSYTFIHKSEHFLFSLPLS